MSNKAYLEFEGFNEAIARLNKLNANTKNISEKSLKKTHEIITKKAQEALDHASEAAVMLGHSYIGSEHLLIGLIQTEECLASAVLAEYDVTDEKIINLVYQLIAPEGAVCFISFGRRTTVRICTHAESKICCRYLRIHAVPGS